MGGSRDVLLHGAELDAHDELALAGNVLEHVGLETAQHVRTEQVVQPLDLLLLADVAERLQEALQVTASKRSARRVRVWNISGHKQFRDGSGISS